RTLPFENEDSIQWNGLDVGQVSDRAYKGSALLAACQVREVNMKDGEGDALHPLDVVSHEAADGSTPYHAHVAGFLPLPEGANMKEYFKEASGDLARLARERRFVQRSVPTQGWEKREE